MASVQLSRSREIKRKRYIPKGFQRIVKKKQFAVFHIFFKILSVYIVYAVKVISQLYCWWRVFNIS